MAWRRGAVAALGVVACGTQSSSPAAPHTIDLTLHFAFDAPPGGEQYQCFGFDASPLAGKWLTGVDWTPPTTAGGAELHHASLYAFPQDYPSGPVSCDVMPTAWTMHIWVPGGTPMTLPSGVAVALPPGTQRYVIQAHALRVTPGSPGVAAATIHATDVEPEHVAVWLPAAGSVPALRPHLTDRSSTTCVAASAMHVLTATPHMHRLGTAFQAAFVKPDGTRTVVVDVPSWNFDQQKSYVVNRDLAAGDGLETDCTWTNPTDSYVLPGSSTHDEMCGQALIVWPAQAAWVNGCR
jgi:hypothetical protein